MADLIGSIVLMIIGIIIIFVARMVAIDEWVNKIMYIVGVIIFLVGILFLVLALVGVVI